MACSCLFYQCGSIYPGTFTKVVGVLSSHCAVAAGSKFKLIHNLPMKNFPIFICYCAVVAAAAAFVRDVIVHIISIDRGCRFTDALKGREERKKLHTIN